MIGGGILADCWRPEERGKSLSFYYIFPLIGPAVGPILGGFVVRYTDWQWMFYITSIASAAIQLVGLLALPETYGPIILQRKAARLRATCGNPNLRTEYADQRDGVVNVLAQAFVRPCKLLATQMIVQVLALYTAFVYGLMYLALSTFAAVWVELYHEHPDIACLNYLSLGIGFTLGTQVCAPINDRLSPSLELFSIASSALIKNGLGIRQAESPQPGHRSARAPRTSDDPRRSSRTYWFLLVRLVRPGSRPLDLA